MTAIPKDIVITAIREAFEHRRCDRLDEVLADAIELRPPTYGKSWHGRPLVRELLRFASESFDTLRYTDVLCLEGALVLRFEADVGGKPLSGVDMVRLDNEGRIALFEIFSRPPKVALLLLERMTDRVRLSPDVATMMQAKAVSA